MAPHPSPCQLAAPSHRRRDLGRGRPVDHRDPGLRCRAAGPVRPGHLDCDQQRRLAGSFFGSNQFLIDTEGRKASADDEAAIYLDEAQSLYEPINPGNSLTGTVVFDIPVDAAPASLELHDSLFSGGVTVALTP